MVYTPFGLPTFHMRFSLTIRLNEILWLFLVRRKINKLKIGRLILWIYHPRYIASLGKLREELVIYDCMDDFTSLLSDYEDREENRKKEIELLKRSDLIFGGGYSIAKLKSPFRDDIHVFPSACEIEHFQKASLPNFRIPSDIKSIPHPILGYWGAIDQRIDHELLEHLGVKHPDWSIVLLGPIVKLDMNDLSYLERLTNIYWLGPKDYSILPNYARAFDVCLNPFVLTREGKSLSPTKTLEYLATGKPIVSTPIPDVVRMYKGVIAIADGGAEFEKAVEKCLAEDNDTMKQKRIAFTKGKTWEDIVNRMERLIISALKRKDRGNLEKRRYR